MKVTTRILVGFLAVAALAILGVLFHLSALRSLQSANVDATRSEIESSLAAAQRAVEASGVTVLLIFAIGVLLSFLIVRSVRQSLAELTDGARMLVQGHYDSPMDESGANEFSQLAGSLNTIRARLQVMERSKEDFVSKVSHDLKSPLASIREAIHVMLMELPGPLTPKQRRLMELSSRSGARLSRMTSNVLEFSRLESGATRYDRKEHDLRKILRSVALEMEMAGRERGVTIRHEVPESAVIVRCDADSVTHALQNLIDNAVKFSPEGGEVKVSIDRVSVPPPAAGVRSEEDRNDYAMVSVVDSGPGVSEEDRRKIFERFYQSGRTSALSADGVGLGLTICAKILEAHGADIWVEDAPHGSGSAFRILFSAVRPAESLSGIDFDDAKPSSAAFREPPSFRTKA